jgi:hypothetical protein
MIRITGTVHEDYYTFMTVSLLILFRMKNVLDKSCRENQILCSVTPPENRTVDESGKIM